MVLLSIRRHFAGHQKLPRNVRGLANARVAGAVTFDTFCGRKEWEDVEYDYVRSMLDKVADHIVCSNHKTMRQCEPTAKVLTHGLLDALKVYASLPRPRGFKSFFVPASSTAPHVPFCSPPKTFCKVFVGDGTRYMLRDPEDDVKEAHQLIKAVLGKTVSFPRDDDFHSHLSVDASLKDLIAKFFGGDEVGTVPDEIADGEEDDELEYGFAAKHFGVPLLDTTPLLDMPEDESTSLVPLSQHSRASRRRTSRRCASSRRRTSSGCEDASSSQEVQRGVCSV